MLVKTCKKDKQDAEKKRITFRLCLWMLVRDKIHVRRCHYGAAIKSKDDGNVKKKVIKKLRRSREIGLGRKPCYLNAARRSFIKLPHSVYLFKLRLHE